MNSSPAERHYRILVGVCRGRLVALLGSAVRIGHRVVRLDLSSVGDRSQLCQRCSSTFDLPILVDDIDAVVSLAADLSWWPPEPGYLLVVEGMDDSPLAVVVDGARMFPSIVDRWRSQERAFMVALVCPERSREAALAGPGEAHARLAAHGKLPWAHPGTGPVAVLECCCDGRD